MATILFMPSTGSAAVSPTPSGTDWGHINNVSRPLLFTASGSTRTTLNYAPDGGADLTNKNAMFAQFVSDVLPPQTIPSQDLIIAVDASETSSTNNLFVAWKVYAVSVDGTTVLATLSAIQRDGVEVLSTGLTGRSDGHNAIGANTFTVPFRLVLEIGLGGTPTVTENHNGGMRFGEDTANFSQDASTVSGRPFLLFSSDLQLHFESAQLINSKGLVA